MSRSPRSEGLMREAWAALVADCPGDCRRHLDALNTKDVFVVRALATLMRNIAADSLSYRPDDPEPKGASSGETG